MAIIVKGVPRVDGRLSNSTILWRYLDAAKFLDFIHGKTLFFARGDGFEDKFEGAFTQSVEHAIQQAYDANNINFTCAEFGKKLRERVFVNCWHASQDDSMAMWKLYGGSNCSVAITTTVGQLRETLARENLPFEIAISKVSYVKHWHDPKMVTNPYSNVFAYKVKAYQYEKEVRVIIDRFADEFDAPALDKGMSVDISTTELLRSIVVAPEAPQWFVKLIYGVVKPFGITCPVHRSRLAFPPGAKSLPIAEMQ